MFSPNATAMSAPLGVLLEAACCRLAAVPAAASGQQPGAWLATVAPLLCVVHVRLGRAPTTSLCDGRHVCLSTSLNMSFNISPRFSSSFNISMLYRDPIGQTAALSSSL